jgi:hypothetical protein
VGGIAQVFPPGADPGIDPGPVVTVDTATRLSGIDPTTTCAGSFGGEAYPERSMNTLFGGATPALFSGWGISLYANATDWNAWPNGATSPQTIYPSGSYSGGVDWWSATSGATGFDYLSTVLHDTSTQQLCFAIGAATPANRAANTWDYPLRCVTGSFDNGDGPSIAFDPSGGSTLWAAQEGPGQGAQMFIFPTCTSVPTAPGCALGSTIAVSTAVGHPVVATDPCTHDGILAYRDTSSAIHLTFYAQSGAVVQDLVTRPAPNNIENEPEDPTSACVGDPAGGLVPHCGQTAAPECDEPGQRGQQFGCLYQVSKVQVATQTVGGKCYAYVGYDSSHASKTDGRTYMRATLDVVDITAPGSASLLFGYRDADEFATYSSFGTVTAAADTPTPSNAMPAGWFFYTEFNNEPCTSGFQAVVSIDQFGSLNTMTEVSMTPTSFPIARFAPLGNDYLGTIKRGLPQGMLYPTWFQPIPMTSGSCVSCGAQQLSATVMATRLHIP